MAKVLELSFSISPSNEYLVLIFSRMDWFDLLAVKGLEIICVFIIDWIQVAKSFKNSNIINLLFIFHVLERSFLPKFEFSNYRKKHLNSLFRFGIWHICHTFFQVWHVFTYSFHEIKSYKYDFIHKVIK